MSDFGDVTKVKVGGFNDVVDMGFKGEGGVQDQAMIACQRGRGDGGGVS